VCSAGAASSSHHAASASFRSAIYAYSKAALYASASAESGSGFRSVFAALWISEKAWYRSVPAASAGLLSAGMLNNFVQPVRPQSLEDVFNGPFFVQKVRSLGWFVVRVLHCCCISGRPPGLPHQ
jgi:hypothetical protein